MSPWFIGYFLLGIISYVACWLWSAASGKADEGDPAFAFAADPLMIAIWPLALPFVVKDLLQKSAKEAAVSEPISSDELIGQSGIVVVALRPAGIVEIEGNRIDALADLGVIEVGEEIEVTGRDGFHATVRRKSGSKPISLVIQPPPV